MAVRSGLGAQLGVATETTVGTFKTPTRFIPFENESLSLTKNYIKTAGLRAGRLAQSQNQHRATTRSVGGDFAFEFTDSGMGVLLNQLHGNTVTPEKLAEKSEEVHKQVHEIGLTDPFGKALTIQVGRPDTGGTVRPFSYLGCKIVNFKITIDAGGTAMCSVSVDGMDEVTTETLATATYSATALAYTFQQMEAKVGGTKVANVRSISINIAVGMNTERYHLGNEGRKDQAIVNALLAVTADATLEFSGLADHERYTKEEVAKLELLGTGAPIGEEGEKNEANFTLAAAKQVSSSPVVQGPDVLTTDVTFEGLDNGAAAPLVAEILSEDTAL